MAPRTILYTGKGGVGKTSVAACTARRCAAAGARTLVMSTDPAHSLADALETPLEGKPTGIDAHLFGQQVSAQDEMERNWSAMQDWLGDLLMRQGGDRISAEELTVPPGADELFSLLQLKRHYESGDWDVIVVDCAPTGETLRLPSFPAVARWWRERVSPWEKQIMAAAAPIARGVLDMPLPGRPAIAEVRRLVEHLLTMHELLRDHEHVSLRLVMTPDRMVIAEAMRTFTYLNLYGYLTDAVVVNRVFPPEVEGGYFGAWRAVQSEQMELVRSGFGPVPVLVAPYFDQEVVGGAMLDRLGDALFEGVDAGALLYDDLSQELVSDNGTATLRLAIPFVEKGDVELKKIGLEVIVRVGAAKRTIILPPTMAAYRPRGAQFEDGALSVRFERADARSTGDDAPD